MSGHSYSVPALCETLSENADIHLHITSKNNLLFNPSFKIYEYEPDLFFTPILSSKKMKFNLKKKVKDGDIIHNHGLWRMHSIYPLDIKKDKTVKTIISPRGSLSKEALSVSKYKKIIFNLFSRQKKALLSCDAFHATSLKEKDEIRLLGYKQPIAIIPNGIDIPSEKKIDFKHNNHTKFLYLGRIHPIKGLDILINAWSEIESKNQSCYLEICGYYNDIKYYNYLKKMVKDLNLKNVSFSKSVSGIDKKNKYLESDIFILPSKSENFGIVIAEAMSFGLPVITSSNTPWEIIKENNSGWFINLNHNEICSAIYSANKLDKNQLKKMGANGRNYIKNSFSWKSLAKDYYSFYNWILNDKNIPNFVDILKQ